METLKRTRLIAVRLGLVLTLVAAAVAFPFSELVAKGIAMGALAGVLAFWLFALRLEKVVGRGGSIEGMAVTWTFVRLAIYAAALARALFLDMENYSALLGAVGGLFIIRFVLMFLAFTGMDLQPKEEK